MLFGKSALALFHVFFSAIAIDHFFTMHFLQSIQMHLILLPGIFFEMFYAWHGRAHKNPASAKIRRRTSTGKNHCIKFRGVFMSILFIGTFQSFAIFNCQSSRMEMKLSFRHKCISRRISDIVFMSHNIARIYLPAKAATWSDWFKSAINKMGETTKKVLKGDRIVHLMDSAASLMPA